MEERVGTEIGEKTLTRCVGFDGGLGDDIDLVGDRFSRGFVEDRRK